MTSSREKKQLLEAARLLDGKFFSHGGSFDPDGATVKHF